MRQKAVEAVDRGEQKSQVSRMFGISRNTLDLWLKRRVETGSVAPKSDSRLGPEPKIADLNEFQHFVESRGHLTQQEMADEWSEPISSVTIGKALKAIGFTRKK
ncbi:MAG: helix-turn-helix domain-containing protein, partial [Cyanobacteria bacterium P01_H01_bin.15]